MRSATVFSTLALMLHRGLELHEARAQEAHDQRAETLGVLRYRRQQDAHPSRNGRRGHGGASTDASRSSTYCNIWGPNWGPRAALRNDVKRSARSKRPRIEADRASAINGPQPPRRRRPPPAGSILMVASTRFVSADTTRGPNGELGGSAESRRAVASLPLHRGVARTATDQSVATSRRWWRRPPRLRAPHRVRRSRPRVVSALTKRVLATIGLLPAGGGRRRRGGWAVLWRTASRRLNESLFPRSESSRPGPPRPSRLHPAAMDRSQEHTRAVAIAGDVTPSHRREQFSDNSVRRSRDPQLASGRASWMTCSPDRDGAPARPHPRATTLTGILPSKP